MELKPWEVHTDLSKDRLIYIAETIQSVRNNALTLHDPNEGDGPWSLGCRIYERTINTFECAAKEIPWLKVIRHNLYFVMIVGKVPIRFQKFNITNANSCSLRLRHAELEAHQLAFSFDHSQWYWRLFIETDEFGKVLRIVIAQLADDGNTRNVFEIPLSEPLTLVAPVSQLQRETVVLDEPQIGLRNSNKRVVNNNGKTV